MVFRVLLQVDGDGDLDLIVGDGDGELEYFEKRADGTLVARAGSDNPLDGSASSRNRRLASIKRVS